MLFQEVPKNSILHGFDSTKNIILTTS